MKKFSRKKMALALACASVFGGRTQAMNKNMSQSQKTIAAVGGRLIKIQTKDLLIGLKITNGNWQLVLGCQLLLQLLF